MREADLTRAIIRVKGIVQGVGFRPFVFRIANANDLVGFVRNRGDAGVEIVVEGAEESIHKFLHELKWKRPPIARIDEIAVEYSEKKREFKEFSIYGSLKSGDLRGSIIPPDVSICDKCLNELRNVNDRRHDYFFITCTDCGPRYTIIEGLPYDRPTTTMRSFSMCEECEREYKDPDNRRFHAQTVACLKCGPKAFLTGNKGEPIDARDPIREAGKLLAEGHILAIKGNGGFHIATSTTKSRPILRLRRIKNRPHKPFAIMSPSIYKIKSFANVSAAEEALLTSHIKPIILLRKNENYYLSELISPDLHTVGVMLPYTGLHAMLFDEVKEPALLMTSANPSDEPIVAGNKEALERLGSIVDFFLFHDRDIAQRCDDSVVRFVDGRSTLIRRSRGYIPEPIYLEQKTDLSVLGVGAEENVVSCLLSNGKAFLSQYIGETENLSTFRFFKDTINHMLSLTKIDVDMVACDLHPGFNTTRYAHRFAEEHNCEIYPIQHHYAHVAALMSEHNINEIVCIVCDGFGLGLDGNAWGGEVIYGGQDGIQRLGHLEEQPMVGGDLATKNPLRMAAGILYGETEVEEWLLDKANFFPYGETEVNVVLKQLRSGRFINTTSCGRILDAISAILDVCHKRTYEGEPAMRLESTAIKGKDVLDLAPQIRGSKIGTTKIVTEVFEHRGNHSAADLACSAQSYLARSLAELAVLEATRLSVNCVGFSGGVAFNDHITRKIKKNVEKSGLEFVVHGAIPPGDGGISFGQTIAALMKTRLLISQKV
ncbi:MAG: carbamoyltransferase HypF [Promethearchaeota archaeon]